MNREKIDMGHSEEDPEFLESYPDRIRKEITKEDLDWIREMYESVPYMKVKNRSIEILKELQGMPIGKKEQET